MSVFHFLFLLYYQLKSYKLICTDKNIKFIFKHYKRYILESCIKQRSHSLYDRFHFLSRVFYECECMFYFAVLKRVSFAGEFQKLCSIRCRQMTLIDFEKMTFQLLQYNNIKNEECLRVIQNFHTVQLAAMCIYIHMYTYSLIIILFYL